MEELTMYLEELKRIRRIKDSFEEMNTILTRCFTLIPLMIHHLDRTYRMARVRINETQASFKTIDDLSFKPRELNTTFQRASIPNETMLYASSCERRTWLGDPLTDEEDGIKIALFETIAELRENCLFGKGRFEPNIQDLHFLITNTFRSKRVTYAIWEVTEKINLARPCPTIPIDYDSFSSRHLQDYIFSRYFLDKYIDYKVVRNFYNFMAFEFTRIGRHLLGDLDYMISAITSNILCKSTDGISFQSARCDGYGNNFAINPKIVGDKLMCVEVGELNVSCVKNRLELDYIKKIQITDPKIDLTQIA